MGQGQEHLSSSLAALKNQHLVSVVFRDCPVSKAGSKSDGGIRKVQFINCCVVLVMNHLNWSLNLEPLNPNLIPHGLILHILHIVQLTGLTENWICLTSIKKEFNVVWKHCFKTYCSLTRPYSPYMYNFEVWKCIQLQDKVCEPFGIMWISAQIGYKM